MNDVFEIWVKTLMNPFYRIGMSITSPVFRQRVGAAGRKWLWGALEVDLAGKWFLLLFSTLVKTYDGDALKFGEPLLGFMPNTAYSVALGVS